MEETLIKYDTAVLAKDKGFKSGLHADFYIKKQGHSYTEIPVVSQSLLQKWIREQPTPINVTPFTDFITWQVEIQHPDKVLSIIEKNKDGIWFGSYEEALEAGLIEALKLIP